MRIGIDIRNIGKKRTGDEAVFFNLVKNLAELDNNNEYLLFTDILDENTLNEIKNRLDIESKKNFQIISLPTANKFTWNAWTLPQYLKKNPVDIYHTQYILPFLASKSIKLVTTIHDVSFNAYPEMIKITDLFFLKLLIPWSLKRADKIIAPTKFTKDEIIKYYKIDPEKIIIVENAVGENFEKDISPEKLAAVRKKYNLPEKFILYLGTLQPRKNIPVLIEAFASLIGEESYIKLVIAGNRESYNFDKKIDTAIQKYSLEKKVYFPGFIDEEDKPAIFKLAEIFCFPSLYEGFGIPILESMAAGTPVIASNIPTHKEISGISALFFNPKDPKSLLETMLKVLNDTRQEEELIARSSLQCQRFSWKQNAEKTLAIYQKASTGMIDKT